MDKHHDQKSRRSALQDPVLLGAAMKAIYESSDVSVRRGDETKVVTQFRDQDKLSPLVKDLPKSAPHPAAIPPTPTPSHRPVRRPSPFSSIPPQNLPPTQSVSQPPVPRPAANLELSNLDTPTSYRSYSSNTEIIYWISLVAVFLGVAYWISL